MESFLGVPIMVRDKAYGNLYVTEKQGGGEFSEADEQVALMLASQAAIAIEHAQAFRALAETQEELLRKEKLAMLGQLAGGVGHELRNPLGVIKNSVYYLEMILPEEARARKHLGILDREVGTANRIVSDLLEFARMKSGEPVPDRSEGCGRLLERLPVPETVAVAWEMPDGPAPSARIRLHVEQILTNLITNAVQAMPDGGTLTIAVAGAHRRRAQRDRHRDRDPPRGPAEDLPAPVHHQAQGHRPWPGSGQRPGRGQSAVDHRREHAGSGKPIRRVVRAAGRAVSVAQPCSSWTTMRGWSRRSWTS